MDKDLLQYLINLSIAIPFFILVMILSIKLSKSNLHKIKEGRYAQVIERTSLTKDTNMFVIKTGNEGCLVLVSQSHTQKIKDLSSEEINEIIRNKEHSRFDNFNKKKSEYDSTKSINLNILPKKILDKENKIWKH